MTGRNWILIIPFALASVLGSGCSKKVALSPPPPQPPPTVAAASRAPAAPESTPSAPAYTPTPAPAAASSRYPDKATRDRIDVLLGRISDAYFDYDQHTLRPDAVSALQKDSIELRDILKQYPDYKLVIEGHADERGSEEYNLGLANERAESAKNYLVQVGIPARQLSVVSYGKDKPACMDHNESCWQKNRRIHIVPAANQPA